MAGFFEEADRGQLSLLPGSLDDWVGKDNPVRVIDAFVDGLDLKKLDFETVDPLDIGRPGYHPSVHLKLYIYGYLYRVQSSRRLERECHRNLEVMWLLDPFAGISFMSNNDLDEGDCWRTTAAFVRLIASV